MRCYPHGYFTSEMSPLPCTTAPGQCRNETTFLKGPLKLWNKLSFGTAPIPASFHTPQHHDYTGLKKKKQTKTKRTIERNSLFSFWIMNSVRFPINSNKRSCREPSPVTQLYLGLAVPRASLWYHLAATTRGHVHQCCKERTTVMGKHHSCPEIPSSTLVPTWAEGNTEAFQFLSWHSSHSPEGEVKSLQAGLAEPHAHHTKAGKESPPLCSSGRK